MTIKEIAYRDPISELIADVISSEIDVKKYRYNNPILEPDTLVLGMNTQHYLSRSLTNLPIIVFDQHTDMFSGRFKFPEEMSNINWIYWKLKDGEETHLVLPNYNPLPGDLTLPIENKENFHLYIVNQTQRPVIGNLDNGTPYELRPHDIGNLEILKKIKKQVSIDFDFFRDIDVKDAIGMLKLIKNEKNLYDFWLDYAQNFETRVENCINLIKVINSPDSKA